MQFLDICEICRDGGDFLALRFGEADFDGDDMIDSDTSSIGTFAAIDALPKIRKEFPENWIWDTFVFSHKTG